MTARILTLSLPDPARHPRAEALIDATVEDLIDGGALARGTAGIPMTLTPQDLPLPSESEALYALEDCHYEAVQSWLEEYDWQALVGAAIRTPQQV